jgi:hypothetical protein
MCMHEYVIFHTRGSDNSAQHAVTLSRSEHCCDVMAIFESLQIHSDAWGGPCDSKAGFTVDR